MNLGARASLASTYKEGFALYPARLARGNPYDGHTLKSVLDKV